MSFESNPSGIGVGKTFGERGLGGVNGEVKSLGKEVQVTFDFSSETVSDVYSAGILSDYVITGLTLYVSEVFGGGATADISVDGGSGLSSNLNLNVVGVSKPGLGGLGNTSGTGPVAVVLDLSDAQTQAATSGQASLVVTYERI